MDAVAVIIVVAVIYGLGSFFLKSPEEKAYEKAEKFPLHCIDCKQAKTHIYCGGDSYRNYSNGIIGMFCTRHVDYCYILKKQRDGDYTTRCGVPMTGKKEIDDAFIRDNEIIHFSYSEENAHEPVFVSLSGRKYHTIDCKQIKGRKYCATLAKACQLGYSPCSKCNPPK